MNTILKRQLSVVLVAAVATVGFLAGCGPKAFVKGDYDDTSRENLLNDQWSETDMQKAVATLVGGMLGHPSIAASRRPPLLMVTNLQNKTSEVIDTQNIMDMIRVELMRSGKVRFIDKEARQDIQEEYNYQGSGMVDSNTRKGPGGQMGADFIVNGRLDSIVKEVGKDKTVYYKLTLNLTNLKTSEAEWADHKEIRKTFRKRSIGL